MIQKTADLRIVWVANGARLVFFRTKYSNYGNAWNRETQTKRNEWKWWSHTSREYGGRGRGSRVTSERPRASQPKWNRNDWCRVGEMEGAANDETCSMGKPTVDKGSGRPAHQLTWFELRGNVRADEAATCRGRGRSDDQKVQSIFVWPRWSTSNEERWHRPQSPQANTFILIRHSRRAATIFIRRRCAPGIRCGIKTGRNALQTSWSK